jgi:hypothetical protein
MTILLTDVLSRGKRKPVAGQKGAWQKKIDYGTGAV